MKELPLTRGLVALVDDEDFVRLSRFKYRAIWNGTQFYAMRNSSRTEGKRRGIYLHREILNAPNDKEVHHLDGCGLRCVRENLQLRTPSQNARGYRKKMDNTTSTFRGVRLTTAGTWEASIQPALGYRYLGVFGTEIEAAKAYDVAAKEMFGEFASLNFP